MRKILAGLNREMVQSLVFWNCWAIVFAFVLFTLLRNQKHLSKNVRIPDSLLLFTVITCYVVSVISITIIPLPFSAKYKATEINFQPLVHTIHNLFDPVKRQNRLLASDVIWNIAGNVIMFIPLGYFLPLVLPRLNRYRKAALIVFATSFSIETIQMVLRLVGNYRQVDIDDVILNTCGGLLGYFVYRQTTSQSRNSYLSKKQD